MLGGTTKRLMKNAEGNVVLTFALAFPVLLGATGLAVDSAGFYDQHDRMQSVADSSALAVATTRRGIRGPYRPAELGLASR